MDRLRRDYPSCRARAAEAYSLAVERPELPYKRLAFMLGFTNYSSARDAALRHAMRSGLPRPAKRRRTAAGHNKGNER